MPYKDPEKRREYHRNYIQKYRHKPSRRVRTLEQDRRYQHAATCKRYGITPEIYQATFLAQGSCCASCGSPDSGGKHSWHIDHDHETNLFRGILCHHCNVGVGVFKENRSLMLKAIEYLDRVKSTEKS